MSLGGEGWMRDEFPEKYECDSFNPYTSNPQLCRCGRPVTEHKTFMAKWTEAREKKRVKDEAYELKRAKLLELSGIEIEPEEVIEIGGIKLKRSEFEKLRAVAIEMMNQDVTMSVFDYPEK